MDNSHKKFDTRSRLKNKHRKDKDDEVNIPQELIDEATELGCEVWEIEKVKAKLKEEQGDSSLEEVNEEENEEESKSDKKKNQKKNKKQADSDDEEEKKEPEADDSDEVDSDDAELERLYGMGRNAKTKQITVEKDGKKKKEVDDAIFDNSDSNDEEDENFVKTEKKDDPEEEKPEKPEERVESQDDIARKEAQKIKFE